MRNHLLDRRRIAKIAEGNANTFIDGAGTYITTREKLAEILELTISDIQFFNIQGSNVQAKITTPYNIPQNAFNNQNNLWGGGDIVKSFRDPDGMVRIIGRSAFLFQTSLIELITPEATQIEDLALHGTMILQAVLPEVTSMYWYRNFNNNNDLRLIYMPKLNGAHAGTDYTNAMGSAPNIYIPACLEIGTTDLDQAVFNSSPNGVTIWAHADTATLNGGAEEGDLAYARANKAANILYETKSDFFIKPSKITDLSAPEIHTTVVELSFTIPATTHPILGYRVFLNGTYYVEIGGPDSPIVGLKKGTNYDITVKAYDEFGNLSDRGKVINVDTLSVSPVPTNGLLAYYKLDESSGLPQDSHGTNHVDYNKGVYLNKTGKIGKGVWFDGGWDYLRIPGNDLNIVGDLGISLWIKPDQNNHSILSWANGSYTTFPFHLKYLSDERIILNRNGTTLITNSVIPMNTWTHIAVSVQNGEGKIYLNGVEDITGTVGDGATGDGYFTLGREGEGFAGYMDEVSIYNRHLTPTEVGEFYNNGNGITL